MNDTTRNRANVLTLLAASSLAAMAGAVISPALPHLAEAFGDRADIELLARLVLALPALVIAVTAPLAGLLADRWGGRPLLTASLLLYALGGTSGLYLESLAGILVGRALLGVGVAGVLTATTLMLTQASSPAHPRSQILGWQGAVTSGGAMLFLLAGGTLADLSWRAPFAVYLLAFLLVPAALLFVTRANATRPDIARQPPPAWRRTPWRRLLLVLAAAVGSMALFYLVPVQAPFLLSDRLGASGMETGLAIGISTLPAAAGALLFGRLLARLGHSGTLATALALTGAGYLLLAAAHSWIAAFLALSVAGVGFGLLAPNVTSWIADLAPVHLRGRLIGMLSSALFLGRFLAPFLAEASAREESLGGVAAPFVVGGAVTLALGLLIFASNHLRASHLGSLAVVRRSVR